MCAQRSDIIKAAYEPTEEECEWKQAEDEELSVSNPLHFIHAQHLKIVQEKLKQTKLSVEIANW